MILWCGESIGAAAEWGTTQYHNMAGQVRRDTAERKRQEAAFHQIRQEAALRQHLGAAYDEAGAERRRLAAEAQASSGDLCVAAEQTVRAHRCCHRMPVDSTPNVLSDRRGAFGSDWSAQSVAELEQAAQVR